MNLVIDAGNTSIKIAVFKQNKLLFKHRFLHDDFLKEISEVFKKYPDIQRAVVSNVAAVPEKSVHALAVFCPVYTISSKTKIPFKNAYNTKETLGTDRLALATAAFYTHSHKNVLVIGAGTCITYDIVDASGTYLGGAISPGIRMRYKALHTFTANLPLLETQSSKDFIGKSTKGSIHSGVVNGVVKEIEGVIIDYKARFKDLTVILTGGDAVFLSKQLKNSIFANSNFLLEGLNYILEYNKQ